MIKDGRFTRTTIMLFYKRKLHFGFPTRSGYQTVAKQRIFMSGCLRTCSRTFIVLGKVFHEKLCTCQNGPFVDTTLGLPDRLNYF